MKKSILAFLLAAPLLLASCVRNNGLCYTHKDENLDGICDVCGAEVPLDHEHIDMNADGKCDICGYNMAGPGPQQPCKDGEHVDVNPTDGKCDICGADVSKPAHTHIDLNPHDGSCDICGAVMEICTNHVDANNDGYCDHCGEKIQVSEVTVYLVLTSVGLYKGAVGMNYADLNIENAITWTALSGTALPGKEDVTHAYNTKATFESWLCYEGKGAPTVYTTVPNETGKILYANFVADGYNPTPGPTPGPDPTPGETKTYYLLTSWNNGADTWDKDGAVFYTYAFNSSSDYGIYSCSNVSDNKYSVDVPTKFANIIFVRCAPGTTSTNLWEGKWNQTGDIAVQSDKNTIQITSWDDGFGKCGSEWVA